MRLMCEEMGICQIFLSVEHPQFNGQVEAANKVILQGLKKKLGAAKARWVEILPEVVWSYHTMVQSTTKETPFGLVYGGDVVLPIEIEMISRRVDDYLEKGSKKGRLFQLDTIDELRNKEKIWGATQNNNRDNTFEQGTREGFQGMRYCLKKGRRNK
ncbi:uncharacterized protein [Phaseolus vulgaris]|uniref:uncharacterized protein n=1 Tax=Phaseolus vulgaris TaxID=3885 RepID=UPI0035CC6F67